jgi:hypothetical protein
VNFEGKGAKSIPIAHRAEVLIHSRRGNCCIDTLALNGLALPPFFDSYDFARGACTHEADLSAEQSAPQAHPWVPCTHGDEERAAGAGEAPRQGPAQADTLSRPVRFGASAPRDSSLLQFHRAEVFGVRCQGG